eukprot:1114708-Rhodomonas_salina.1
MPKQQKQDNHTFDPSPKRQKTRDVTRSLSQEQTESAVHMLNGGGTGREEAMQDRDGEPSQTEEFNFGTKATINRIRDFATSVRKHVDGEEPGGPHIETASVAAPVRESVFASLTQG